MMRTTSFNINGNQKVVEEVVMVVAEETMAAWTLLAAEVVRMASPDPMNDLLYHEILKLKRFPNNVTLSFRLEKYAS